MRKYIGVVSVVLFVVVLGIISFAFFAKKDDNAITQTIFLRKVSSNLEYPIVNNEEELLEILKNEKVTIVYQFKRIYDGRVSGLFK